MAQDRGTFQQLAEVRLKEAAILLASGQPSGAYYLAGYAVECGLKAKLASEFREHEIPDLKRVQNIHTHDLGILLSVAGLKAQLDDDKYKNPSLSERWTLIQKWSEKSRYQIWTETNAIAMLDAISGDEGFMAWLQKRW